MADTIAHSSLRWAIAWLAVAGLLSGVLLPTAAMSIAVDQAAFRICSAASAGDLPGKDKPGLLVHHCPLCAVPAVLPPGRQPGALLSDVFAQGAHPLPRTISLAVFYRHGPVQARAPPLVA